MAVGNGSIELTLDASQVRSILSEGLEIENVAGKRLLCIIPDGTRSGPIPMMFRLIHDLLAAETSALDFLIALGTHQPMNEVAIQQLLGVTAEEMNGRFAGVNVFNHQWENPDTFVEIGSIDGHELESLSKGFFTQSLPVKVNRLVFDYDHILICGPVFPHEVAGFSGGNKYFFPGVSGPEVIDFSHWLGALISNYEIIGTKYTPVRAIIDRAASMIDRPTSAICMVVKGSDLYGLYVGSPEDAWSQAVDLSSQLHIIWVDRPYDQVLSVMPPLYDDLWTGAKGMYKMEPVIADGGSVTIFAPGIDEISYTHGAVLDEVGYHVRDYFVKQWDRFKHYPWGVLAHSTHLRGQGSYQHGIEQARVDVILATGITPERCRRVSLAYQDPADINLGDWQEREHEAMLLVPHAGEMLYRLKPSLDT